MRDKETGFSLIELLIVVAIILVIAAIAIPNLLQARLSANESSAAASVRQINTAQMAYYQAYPTIGYASALPVLGGVGPCTPSSATACVLDDFLANAVPGSPGKSGYQFQSTGLNGGGTLNNNFVTGATPIILNKTGNRNFCAIDDGVLRVNFGIGGMPPTVLATCLAYPVAQ
ncbi:MAG TPA: prepilin-type N-terminal cleavage/methylation domain-containing protein [Terriglobales bacterium]|jgi:prepilin-type N-terminal cleavage/methylation domain-containing protein